MKNNQPVTQKEVLLDDTNHLVSSTNVKTQEEPTFGAMNLEI